MSQVIDRRSHFLWILGSIFRWALYQAKGIAAPDTPNFNYLRTDGSRYYTLTREGRKQLAREAGDFRKLVDAIELVLQHA